MPPCPETFLSSLVKSESVTTEIVLTLSLSSWKFGGGWVCRVIFIVKPNFCYVWLSRVEVELGLSWVWGNLAIPSYQIFIVASIWKHLLTFVDNC